MRLGLTTTSDRIRTLMPEVSRLGFDPVSLPCILVDAVPGGSEKLAAAVDDADALVVTSARTVAMLVPGGLPPLPIIAVGPETAAAAEEAGGTVVWVGSNGVRHVADEAGHLLQGGRIILAGASNTAHESATALEIAGSSVVSIELYTTVPIAPPHDAVDAVIFGSPTAVTGWLISRELSGLLLGAIGPTTAAALRGNGVEPDVVPDRPGFVNTIELLAALRPERSTP